MTDGGYGEVFGEVIEKHLTIGRADKQGEAEPFGEVLSIFSLNIFWMENVHPLEMVCKHVADGL